MAHCDVDSKPIIDFCSCVDQVALKDGVVYFKYADGSLYIHGVNYAALVVLDLEVEGTGSFEFGVAAPRLIATFKKLYSGSVRIFVTKTKVKLEAGNVSVSLGIVEYVECPVLPDMKPITGPVKDWMVESMVKCNFAATRVGDAVQGVLVDSGEFLRVCKMNVSSIRLITYPAQTLEAFRIYVPLESSKVFSKFKDSVQTIHYMPSKFGIELESGVFVCLNTLEDTYPPDYVTALGMFNGLNVIADGVYGRYAFKTEDLNNALDLANSVLGDDSPFVTLKLIGSEPSSGFPVWDIGGKSYDTCSVSEKLVCIEAGVADKVSFSVNRKDAASILKTYGEQVIIFNEGVRPLVCSTIEGLDVTMLLKVA